MLKKLFLDLNNFKSNLGSVERGDSIELNIKLLNDEDYSRSKFRLLGAKSDGKSVEQIEGLNLEEKDLKVVLEDQFVNCEGIVKLELNVVSGETEITTKEFYFFVSNTMNASIIDSADSLPTLEKVSKYVDDAVNNLDALKEASEDIALINGEFKENEIKRKANELLRERSEKERVRLESIRTTEEADRIKAEAERKEAENNRKVAESNRKLAENTRKTNEAARVEAELNRQSLFEENEEIRNSNENLRIASEKERIKFNSEAKTDELNRKEAEKNRVLAEEERKSSEESRVAAEAIRQNTYTDFNDSEAERKNNEIKRQEAEALRVEAETRRDNLFSEKEEERNTVFEESETVREGAFKISEKARNDAEELRVTAESERVKSEKLRVDSEKARVLAEEERNTTFTQKEEERNNTFTQNEINRNETFEVAEEERTVAEASRVESESSRVEAETLRVTAETGRVEAENLRVTAEEERVAAETKREEGFNAFEGRISANTEELKAARSATTGEKFNSLDERIDCEVDRLNKEIEDKFNQINYLDTPSKIFENSRFVRYSNDGQPNAIHVDQDGSSTIHFYKINPVKRYFFNKISSGLSKIAFFASLDKDSGIHYFNKDLMNWNTEITAPSNANYVALEFIPSLANTMFLGEIEKFDLFKKYKKNTELNSKILVKDLEDRIEKLETDYVTIGKNGNFKTIKEGFEYAFKNDMKVKIESGVYDLVKEGVSGKGYFAPKEIWGYGVTLICELPEENWELSPINISMDSEGSKIYGLTIICNNCRYCIHDDMGGQMIGDIKIPFYHNVYKDLKLIHKSPQSSVLKAPQCIGGGFGDYGFIEIDNCVFESEIYADVSYHSKSWSPQTPQTNNCIVMCKDSVFKSTFSISAIGDDTSYMNTIYISNCLMKTLPDKRERPNIEFVEWNNVKKIDS